MFGSLLSSTFAFRVFMRSRDPIRPRTPNPSRSVAAGSTRLPLAKSVGRYPVSRAFSYCHVSINTCMHCLCSSVTHPAHDSIAACRHASCLQAWSWIRLDQTRCRIATYRFLQPAIRRAIAQNGTRQTSDFVRILPEILPRILTADMCPKFLLRLGTNLLYTI